MNASSARTTTLDRRLDGVEERLPALPASLFAMQRSVACAAGRTAASGAKLVADAAKSLFSTGSAAAGTVAGQTLRAVED
ncbi:MAG: hypothetical protein KDB24_13510, partial [Microthrixaceae bacterium]|nr:hypothetical protein [Microthrixaceae bacterium]